MKISPFDKFKYIKVWLPSNPVGCGKLDSRYGESAVMGTFNQGPD
jgi:hypothetical protein